MYSVKIEFQCGCFKKSGYEQIHEFVTKEEALVRAEDMISDMNESFCGAHRFGIRHEEDTLVITVKSNF